MDRRLQSLLRSKRVMLLVACVLLGLVLRVWGADFGLPQSYHADELIYVPDAVRYISTMDFKPSRWANPTLFKYLLALEYGIVYLVNRVMGQFESLSSFEPFFLNEPSIFYLLGRLSSAALGTATIPVVYAIGAQAYGRRRGLVAAFLLTLCFLHVRDSHYAVSDVPMTFFFSVSILCCLLYLRHRTSNYLYLASAFIGMAIATKYTAMILVPVFVVTWAVTKYAGNWRDLVSKEFGLAVVIMGLAFLVCCPYALLDYRGFLGTLRAHYGMGKIGFAGYQIDPAGGYVFYLKTLVWGMGPVLAIVAVLSVGYALYRHHREDCLILLPILSLYVFLGRQGTFFGRFIIPALPLLAVLVGRFLWDVAIGFPWGLRVPAGIIATVLAVLTIAPSALSVVRHNVLLAQSDTRTIAKRWIESNVPAGSKFFVEWHTPPLATESQPVPDSSRTFDVSKSYIVGMAEHPLDYYRQNGYQYLVTSSFIYNIPRIDSQEDESRRAFYADLDVEAELIKTVHPYSTDEEPPSIFDQLYGPATSLFEFDRPGPTIKIYRLQR